MRLEFQRKTLAYNVDGSVRGTEVTLGNLDGATYPIILPADKIDLSNAELEDMALEVIYQENFPMRAENEKFNTFDKKIAEIDAATARSKEQYEKVEEMIKITTAMVNELISTLQGEEDEPIEQN
ncbi:DUF1366 domain-containing protein [Streptococcus minor]|uniref:DUF1366 domain-containing protein n=1 Tax=Streptococcus minor TaxID=229549 RepID=UPI00035FD406|nr:DUF1366 domain-containing protein [Streptococcus minor]